jgi:uroporphyrin-III C-methyltransferase
MTETTSRPSVGDSRTDGEDPRPGAGDDPRPATGDGFRPGIGDDPRPGIGDDPRLGAGDDARPGAGVAGAQIGASDPMAKTDDPPSGLSDIRRDPSGTPPEGRWGVPNGVAPARRSPPYWVVWLLVAVLVLGALSWFAQNRMAKLERDFARRVQVLDTRGAQRDEQVRLAQDLVRDSQARVTLLEAKVAESVGQQAQLRQLYNEMARSRGDLMLADVENSIILASQQLQMTGSIQGALLALQDADQALARSNQPALIGLRRLLARDMERLKALPVADFPTLVARLDAVIAAVDQLPMLSEVQTFGPARASASQPVRPGTITVTSGAAQSAAPIAAPADAPPAAPGGFPGLATLRDLSDRMTRTGRQGWDALVAEFRQLVRVQRVDQADALLLAPDQRYFARENLRLLLMHARLSLLARNEALVRNDLARATQAVERYFDRESRTVASTLVTLRQLQSARLAVELPSLSDSIGAVRAARAASDASGR